MHPAFPLKVLFLLLSHDFQLMYLEMEHALIRIPTQLISAIVHILRHVAKNITNNLRHHVHPRDLKVIILGQVLTHGSELLIEYELAEYLFDSHVWLVDELLQPIVLLLCKLTLMSQLLIHLGLLGLKRKVIDEPIERWHVFLLLGEIESL